MNLGHSEMDCPGLERYELVEESAERRCLAEQSLNRSDHEEHGDQRHCCADYHHTTYTNRAGKSGGGVKRPGCSAVQSCLA